MVPMQRPKWLSGWKKRKNLLEGFLIIDMPDFKVTEAYFDNKLLLLALGVAQLSGTTVPKERNVGHAEEDCTRELEWRIFYEPTAIPYGVPLEKAKEFMAGAVAVTSKSLSVYNKNTVFIPHGRGPSKGNAPLLLSYYIAKKLEDARKENEA